MAESSLVPLPFPLQVRETSAILKFASAEICADQSKRVLSYDVMQNISTAYVQHCPHISSQKNAWTTQLKPIWYEIPHASMVKIKMAAIVLTSNNFLIACIT